MLTAPDGSHGRQRKIISNAFSDRWFRGQEWVIQKYADLVISRIKDTDPRERNSFRHAQLDHILHILHHRRSEFWRVFRLSSQEQYIGICADAAGPTGIPSKRVLRLLLATAAAHLEAHLRCPLILQLRVAWLSFLEAKIRARVEADTERHDFMTDIMKRLSDEESKDYDGITTGELISNVNFFMVAGTETTAAALQASIHFMLQNAVVYGKLCKEVREAFQPQDEVTIDTADKLEYTVAVLSEAMRMVPPIPAGFLRKVPEEGAMVSGYYRPGNCNVSSRQMDGFE